MKIMVIKKKKMRKKKWDKVYFNGRNIRQIRKK